MALSITATPDLTTTPPSVRLDLSDPAGAVTSVTVVRLMSDRPNAVVRTTDGKPLTLTTSGGARVGTLIDYEAPFGQPITYLANGTAQTGQVTLAVTTPWLIDPSTPPRSQPIEVAEVGSRVRSVVRGTFEIIGRDKPITVTDGRRKSITSQITLRSRTIQQINALDLLLSHAGTLLLNVPTDFGWGLATEYLAIGDVEEQRIVDYASRPDRYWVLPYRVVDAPLGGSSSGPVVDPGTPGGGTGTPGSRTWASLALANGVWSAASARHATWAAAAAG